MGKITPIQVDFSSGELSPRLYGRSDADGYSKGVAKMTNMVADPRGPAIRRVGLRYVTQLVGNTGRIFIFPVNDTLGYIFALTDYKLTPIAFEGISMSQNFVTNPRFRNGSTGWTEEENNGTIIFKPDELIMDLDNSGNPSAHVYQRATLPAMGTYTITMSVWSETPVRLRIGDTAKTGAYLDTVVTGYNVFKQDVSIATTQPYITMTNEEKGNRVVIGSVGITDPNGITNFTTPWSEDDTHEVHVIPAPGGSIIYMTHENFGVRKLEYDYASDSFNFSEVGFTGKPAQWTGSNHPRAGCFHQGRFWLGGTPAEPQTFWASKSGTYEDFTLGSQADEGLVFTMSNLGDIRWMASTKNLLIGTSLGEHIVTSVEGVITPGDIQVTQQSAYGSSHTQPTQVGDQLFYVSPDEQKLRSMQYEWSADNWLSKDLSFFSEHLFKPGIAHMAWAQNPNNLFITVLNNGEVAILSYERGEDIWGWHHHTTEGEAIDVASAPWRGLDLRVFMVKRNDGLLNIEIEPIVQRAYMDSWAEQVTPQPTNIINGVNHLDGKTCQVTIDGAVHPDVIPVDGSVVLDWEGTEIRIGLPYRSVLQTLPLVQTQKNVGSTFTHMKRYNRLYVSLQNSANPLINGERQPTRHPSTPMDTVEPVETHITRVAELGYSRDAIVTIEQDLPLACTVITLAGELAQSIT